MFLFVGQQEIVNYWDFLSETSRNYQKKLVTKTAWRNQVKCLHKCLIARRTWLFARFCWNIFLQWLSAFRTQSVFRLWPSCASCYQCFTVLQESVSQKSSQNTWSCFYRQKLLNFLAQQNPISQHPHIWQPERNFYAEMELRFFQ